MWLWARALAYMAVVGGIHFVAAPWVLLRIEKSAKLRFRGGPSFASGVLLVLIGAALAITSAAYLVEIGRGTPFPLDATRTLVRKGPYRYIRNPQAVAATLIVSGECLAAESRLIWILLPVTVAFLELLARPIEELQLRRRFGTQYVAYRHEVPRWLPHRRRFNQPG